MVLSRAQMAAMPRRTPTQIAEEAYQAAQPRRAVAPDVVGPSGLLLPNPAGVYVASRHEKLLGQIVRAAYKEWQATVAPPELEAVAAAALHDALLKRWPQADMEVFRRYGKAHVGGHTYIEAGRYGSWRVTLPEPMLLPNGEAGFRTSERGSGDPVPEKALPWCDAIAKALDAKTPEFLNAQHWPGQFKAREKRWPLWREIEAAWPRIAEWLAGERASAPSQGNR
jgi:hypothetical protein